LLEAPYPPIRAAALRLLLGQRGAETAGMRWDELDLHAEAWHLPTMRTKNRRAHTVPLPPLAITLVATRLATAPADEPHVFPGLTLTAHDHRQLSALHGGAYTWTDLRRSVATRLAGLGYDETTIGRTLNHARSTVTAKHYNQHAYLEEVRRALTAWDAEVTRILTRAEKSTATVLPMRGRA
jgi:integrase